MSLASGRLLVVRPDGLWGVARVVDLRTGATRWRLPDGMLSGRLLVHKDSQLLTWFNVATGARVADALLQVNGRFSLAGSSQDGSRAVVARIQTRKTTFAIVSPHTQQRIVVLGGNQWGFDALNGDKLYLLQYLRSGYRVRLYDLARNVLVAAPLKDAKESSLIAGTPWVRLSSNNGRYLFTLYIGQSGNAMVHELDTRTATARCIALPKSIDFNTASSYTLVPSPDGKSLYAVSSGDGKIATIDVASAKVRSTFGFTSSAPNSPVGASSAISTDGSRVAVTLAGELFVVNLAKHHVVQTNHSAIALGFAPNGRTLWVVGQKSRVTALKI
ncbi:MAG: YncE family protein [Gaiellaceae bacterium]